MKNISTLLLSLLLITALSCQKEGQQAIEPANQNQMTQKTLTLTEAREWLSEQTDTTILSKLPIPWQYAKSIPTKTGNRIVLKLPGQPTVQGYHQGYRQLSIQRDPETQEITAKFLEIIPDALYFQGKRRIEKKDFTGRINEFDLSYHLVKGTIYEGGRQVGQARPLTKAEIAAFQNNEQQLYPLGGMNQSEETGANGKLAMARVIETCTWYQTSYVDSEGVLVIYAEQFCQYGIYDDGSGSGGGGYNDNGIDPGQYQSGGGGSGGSSSQGDPTPPPPSNLPGENNSNVNPKKMTDCFSNVKTEGAAFQVKLLVVEPYPGTFFNLGPNSFGHVAIQLTKVNGSQAVTQVMGFYGSGSGLDKLVSPSTIKDNGDIEYTMSTSYFTDAQSFQKIIDFVGSPTPQYHYTEYNCARFAYLAARAGGLDVPDPTTTFGTPTGALSSGRGMSPAGMAAALRSQKAASPGQHDISEAGGKAPASKGECK